MLETISTETFIILLPSCIFMLPRPLEDMLAPVIPEILEFLFGSYSIMSLFDNFLNIFSLISDTDAPLSIKAFVLMDPILISTNGSSLMFTWLA